MADVLPTHAPMSIHMTRDHETSAPLPNPPFVFPSQPEDHNEMSSHAKTPSSLISAGSSRSGSRSRPHKLSLEALPAFDFSPAGTNSAIPLPSPSRSPSRRTPPVSHATGHRRNGSEFVGGDITHGGPMLVSTSPTKSEHFNGHRRNGSEFVGGDTRSEGPVLVGSKSTESETSSNAQVNTRLGPPPAKRGHAHRRSGAISNHDLSMILKPPTESKAGSAPTTPSDPMFQRSLPAGLDRSTSQPVLSTAAQDPPSPSSQEEDSIVNSQPRRTRFSEKVDYIPRPLSTISSETSSSMSTIRANHSVSNSISSVVSTSTSSSPPNIYKTLRRGQTLQDYSREQAQERSRPKTAEARSRPSSGDWEWDFGDFETTVKRPSSAPSTSPPSEGTETPSGLPARDGSAPAKQTTTDLFSKSAQATPSPPRNANNRLARRRPTSPTVRPRTSPEPKVTKRQHKGRSWTGLLSRKGKHQDFKDDLVTRRAPTPPIRQPSPEMELSFDEINFDEDTTDIIETGTPYTSRPAKLQTNYATWKPRESSPLSETDNSASILDIDAALGSFDASSSGPSFDDVVAGGGSSVNKRPMHSSGATGGFAGPGMHYHRRTESAPELDVVDRSRFGFPRLGSNPAMAIEEEEEDEEDDRNSTSNPVDTASKVKQDEKKGEQTPGLGVNIVEADTIEDQPIQRARRRPAKEMRLRQEYREDLSPIEIVGAHEEPRFSVITKSSDESTITPTISPDPFGPLPPSAPADLAMPTPALTYGTPDTESATTSPDFMRTSFDAPRMHTATSSITDRTTLGSSRADDHGLGLHGSVDDVPSLTSSASTMSAHPARFSSSANSAADRSSSLSAAVPARRRPVSAHKRLSLASLSRLAGSSYNKSKLNIEESAPAEIAERTEKKRGNRISRMMKFWKPKEKLSSS